MAKRSLESSYTSSSSEGLGIESSKRRKVKSATVDKWILDYDKTLSTSTWMQYERSDRSHVSKIFCSICKRYEDRIKGSRNFNRAFIDGSANLRTSSFRDHAKSDMHERAMSLLKKEQSSSITEYSPLFRSFAKMDPTAERRMKWKFDTAYMIAKEGMAFSKMRSLCQLQDRHGSDLGFSYRNDHACAEFIRYIAQDLREQLEKFLNDAKFFSVQMDGSTDSANLEEEIFLVVYLNANSSDGSVHIRNQYLCVRKPKTVCANGLYDCFKRALAYLGLEEKRSKLIGFGCDGAAVNIGQRGGVKALIQSERPWVVTIWCFAHRLELTLKDALNHTYFSHIDEFLMRVYYLYSKSPKKCQELEDVVSELKECFDSSEFPGDRGVRPLRASGTRFIAHKVSALERIIDRYGAYLNHLVTLSQDPKTRPADRSKRKGYIKNWTNAKVLIGCAYFHDLLKSVAILCKCLQAAELCIVSAIEAILRTSTSLTKLKATKATEFPSVKKVLDRLKEDDCSKTYQGIEVVRCTEALKFYGENSTTYIESVLTCLHDRLQSQGSTEDQNTFSSALRILATHGWNKTDDASFGYEAVQCLAKRFAEPLQDAQVNCALLQQEWDDLVFYAKQYINLTKDSYRIVWWKLFNSPDAKKWLALVELIFVLPLSNGAVEQSFSQLKLVKTNRRTALGEDTLDDCLRIKLEGPPLEDWDPTTAVGLWWSDKNRRVDSKGRSSRSASAAAASDADAQEDQFTCSDWENWFESQTDSSSESDF